MQARKVSNFLFNNPQKYMLIKYHDEMGEKYYPASKSLNNDKKILCCALAASELYGIEDVEFYTNDILLSLTAEMNFPGRVKNVKLEDSEYNGIKEIELNDEEMVEYYSNLYSNSFNLYQGQYLIIRNKEGDVVDTACWDGEKMRQLLYDDITSGAFGRLKPKKGDPYQACLFDSLKHNQVNLITGRAGSGKTLISLAYLFSLLDRKVDRIVIFCNPVAAKNSAKLG